MTKACIYCLILLISSVGLSSAHSEELLVNGDFEIGAPEDDKSASFNCNAWRRLLWREDATNSWLTDNVRDWQIGDENQSLEFRWGATSICQYFSSAGGESYKFSVDYFNPGDPDTRWQPRIQVEWYDEEDKLIGQLTTVAEVVYTASSVRNWSTLRGDATAPKTTAYGRVLLNVNDKGSGQYFRKTYLDNASVQGEPGVNNLPVTFISSPYDITLAAIFESEPFSDSLTNYATDKDGDPLTFHCVSGPDWLTVDPNGNISGTPRFVDAGDNILVIRVDDGRGSTETQTLTLPVIGYLRLGNLFDDDMVLQRDAPIPVWGKAVPNESVRLRMSTDETAETTADENGDWSTVLPPMQTTPMESTCLLVLSGDRELRLSNLLIGDVWVCSGQSNMSWPLEHSDQATEDIAAADNPFLRMVTTPETRSATPWTDLDRRAEWLECQPENVADFSAVAFYFGGKLQEEIEIPIGLINSSQGGSRIENWATSLLPDGADTMYNSRVHPYTRMPIKGVIWYQAEANIADGSFYTAKMESLVNDWHTAWKQKLPFYFVQLAPFNYRGDAVYQLPEMWAAQTAAAVRIPNCDMAVINDIGNIDNIHPTNKKPVGERLALLALNQTYGRNDLVCSGPIAARASREGRQMRIEFEHVESGLTTRDDQPLTWFEMAGEDQVYVPATAVIDGETILVSADDVDQPEYVRFAWHETAQPNLMNHEGLPANSFEMKRSDAQE
jgi:sialate O-acetylesterase